MLVAKMAKWLAKVAIMVYNSNWGSLKGRNNFSPYLLIPSNFNHQRLNGGINATGINGKMAHVKSSLIDLNG
jgi:hypothetical protein